MPTLIRLIETFPSIRLPSAEGMLDIEVSLIAQLGHGAGDHLFKSVVSRLQQHDTFTDELDEPSAKLGGPDFEKQDASSLYAFVVGENGHPFHCHAGQRIFSAIASSGGAQLRFSTASLAQLQTDPQQFVRTLHYINIPPDCLFTVRFGGNTWHQFVPLRPQHHPAFFALSYHPNELEGDLATDLRKKVLTNTADIPSLTILLPTTVKSYLASSAFNDTLVPTTTLSLDAPSGTVLRKTCDIVRSTIGKWRGAWSNRRSGSGYLSARAPLIHIKKQQNLQHSALQHYLIANSADHTDTVSITLTHYALQSISASDCLAALLEGFLQNKPKGVSVLMSIRNQLVKPFGLRTSPLGCPVSSLLTTEHTELFAGKYPVIAHNINPADTAAEVILGIDDKHLMLRSSVAVSIQHDNQITVSLSTAVTCKNRFGKFYLRMIDHLHRHYMSPKLLKQAVNFVLQEYLLPK